MSYSNGSGGTLTLPSPTHVHHVDVSATVRSLRRSLSRSPSKFRLSGIASPTPAKSAVFRQPPVPVPSPAAQSEPSATTSLPATPAGPAARPLSPISFSAPQLPATGTPFRPNIKLAVRSTRSKQVNRPLSRSRVSPKSPLKRVFGSAPDSGNQMPPAAFGAEVRGQENAIPTDFHIASSPSHRRSFERPMRNSTNFDVLTSTKSGVSKFLDMNNETFQSITVSPMKRSDATMSLGQASMGSPVAKRRSLHGISSLEGELAAVDEPSAPPQSFDIHDDGNHEYQLTGSSGSPFRDPLGSPTQSALPKRTTSLRKSTLQQRHGENRSSLGRRAGEKQLAQFTPEADTVSPRARPRLSLDQYVPPEERRLPFSEEPQSHLAANPFHRSANQPHPLSRAITQSSSGPDLPDDTATHIAVAPVSQRRRALHNFSKSLPPGSQRPLDDSKPTATPQYKDAKPLQAAFMSTGLVSKMNRNRDGSLQQPGSTITTMPDTPCKKQPYSSATFPPGSGSGGRRSRVSFGSPSTPFSLVGAPVRGNLFGSQDKSGNLLFQPANSSHARKGSALSLDGDDLAGVHDELPPTPTKNLFFKSLTTPGEGVQSPGDFRSFSARAPLFSLGSDPKGADAVYKSENRQGASTKDERAGEGGAARPSTPFVYDSSPPVGFSFASLAGSRTHPVPFTTPAPARTSPIFFATVNNAANHYARVDPALTASPLNMRIGSPHTPSHAAAASMAPPDPSGLSISNGHAKLVGTPATPSNSETRQLFSSLTGRRVSITPQNGHGPSDLDESLMARFDRSDVVGKGEFSQVYRVVKYSAPASFMTAFSTSPRTPSSPDQSRVYAVKKLRIPVHNVRARQAKFQEVAILASLRHSSKVIQLIDSWEHNGHLYIQTEYCSEGSLDGFLKDVGQAGRLDDFRIWKILLETTQGLSAIHQANFAHLDIKPANIFITFDGYVKIGDFGLATPLPAPKGHEGEGDREYIAPEILRGKFDKPADIFSLGLVILEIACNVFMPDNGPTWQALRNGDLSTVATLTCGEAGVIARDAKGLPIEHDSGISQVTDGHDVGLGISTRRRDSFAFGATTHDASNLFGAQKRTELQHPPEFMLDPDHPHSLDNLVKWMIQPEPAIRPTAEQLLAFTPVAWISSRRAAGATVFEGNWGPMVGPSVAELVDTEMTDV
ncbi:uncharacterized protein B0T15DRAFT_482832 [Chaetomium strumarium]|uniref:Protein kinase domain-containing protein n=1 Tax=Chaetomium strumarium TaxID=1170767 RepID=A0AAJ0M3R1_9PEZI|nr:hypothetical protein B0T15DRAFT_482832 [Chaetomium strumarium]